MAPWLIVQLAYLVVGSAVLLTAVIALATFYLISVIDKSSVAAPYFHLQSLLGVAAGFVVQYLKKTMR